jgi:hypothetical protein
VTVVGGTGANRTSKVPWDKIQAEWKDREYSALAEAVSAANDSAAKAVLDDLLFAPEVPTREKTWDDLGIAFALASDGAAHEAPTDDELLLALYLYGRCLQKWEQTEDYDRIHEVLGALGEMSAARWPLGENAGARMLLMSRIVSQAQAVRTAMDVEDAMSCSCPVAVGTRARRIVTDLNALSEPAAKPGEDLASLREIVLSDARRSMRYFDTIAAVADKIFEFVQLDVDGRVAFDFRDTLEALRKAECDPVIKGDVYESELRAHRVAVEALRDRAENPHVQINAAGVTYVYPFALEAREKADARAADVPALLDGNATVTQASAGDFAEKLTAAGIRPLGVRKLDLNDLWDPLAGEPGEAGTPDRRDGTEFGYSGASIELPPISVTTTATGEPPLEFTAEVRLSRLGNHHLLVRSHLENAGLHEVNQALRRGSRGMGEETFEDLKSATFLKSARFPEYADGAIKTIATALDAEPVINLKAPYHVVLAARSISVHGPDGSSSPASIAEVKRAVGASLLFHPVRHLTTSLEEWIRYPRPTVSNLLAGQGYVGDLVVRTDNTTVSYMRASPEWLIDEYQEMIEFIASVPPILTLWENRASRLDEELETSMREKDVSVETLRRLELRILELEHGARADLGFLSSPALCRTRAQRQFLDRLWKAAGLPALEQELERRLTVLAERQERIAAMLRRGQQEQTERFGHRLEIVLAFIAAASLAGALQWFDDAFGVDARAWAILELTLLVVATLLVVGAFIFRAVRSA